MKPGQETTKLLKELKANRHNFGWLKSECVPARPAFDYAIDKLGKKDDRSVWYPYFGYVIAEVVKIKDSSFAVEIADRVKENLKISEKQAAVLASIFNKIDTTFGDIKAAMISAFGEDEWIK